MILRLARSAALATLALLGLMCLGAWAGSFWFYAVSQRHAMTAHRGVTSTTFRQFAIVPNRVEWTRTERAEVVTRTLNPMLADRPPKVLASGFDKAWRRPAREPPSPRVAWRRPWPVYHRDARPGVAEHVVSVPLAWPTLAFLAPPTLAIALAWRRRRRAARVGLCRVCGFDLRASPERCPECGTPVPASAGPTRSPS